MSSRIKLTTELEQQILASIRAGGYAHVAAAAWGVPEQLWQKWQRWGTGKEARQPYRELLHKVEQAQGQARLKAEMAAMEADPRGWLKHGPGKERPGNPGWAALAKPAPGRDPALDLFTAPAFLQFMNRLRKILAPYPDLFTQVVQTVEASADGVSTAGPGVDSGLTWTDMDWPFQPTFGTDPSAGTMQEPGETEEDDE